MADPIQPSPTARSAARYLRMVGATRRRPGPQHTPTNADPMPPAPQVDPDEVADESVDWAESMRMGPQGQGPDEDIGHVIEVPEVEIEGDPDSFVESLRAANVDEARRGAATAHRDMTATPNAVQHAFVDREHANPVTAVARGLGQSAALGGGMDEILGARDTLGDVGRALVGDEEWSDVPHAYRRNQQRWQQHYENTAEDQPEFYAFGQGLGLAGAMMSPAGPVSRWIGAAPSWGGRIMRSVGAGLGLGHASGALSSEHPWLTREGAADALAGGVGGGLLGGAFAAAGEGISALRRTYGAGRAYIDAQRELGDRSRQILEGDEPLPDFSGTPIDDLDLEDALSAADDVVEPLSTATSNRTPRDEEMSIRSLVTEPLRADPNVQRLRSAGLVTIPQARAVSRQPGGIEAFADDLDRAGVSQRGEIIQTDTGVSRAERLRNRALAQRQRVLREAEGLGVSVNAEELANSLRNQAEQTRMAIGPSARTNAEHIDQIADEIQSLPTLIAMEDEARRLGRQDELGSVLGGIAREARRGRGTARALLERQIQALSGENATPEELDLAHRLSAFMDDAASRPIGLDTLETQIQELTRQARFDRNRGDAVLSPQIQTARGIRGQMVDARIQALEAANAELARQFRNAQRGYQIGVTLVPRDAASRAQLGEMNRSLSLSDMQAGIAGSAAGGPVGGIALALGNRAYRRIEPSLFATINESAILQARASQGQLSESAARMLGYLQRAPDAFGNEGRMVVNATTRGPAAVEAAFRALVGNNNAARAAAQDMDSQAEDIDPWADDVEHEEQIDPWAD